jgi:hypothetical protein
MNWARKPALHFIVLGAGMFAIDRLELSPPWESRSGGSEPALVITAERVATLRRDRLSRTGRLPSSAETDALIQNEIDDELLVREARRLGFERSDPLVRRRLVRNMGFVLAGSHDSDDLFREALGMEMDRTDLVVRRRLIQKLQLSTATEARLAPATDAELLEYLQRHALEFSEPRRVQFVHVYLSRDRRGAELEADTSELHDELRHGSVGPENATEFGDPFLHGHDLPPQSEREIAMKFGAEFAREVSQLPEGSWRGPIVSSYGKHLVWIQARHPRQPAQLEVVRGEVREALLTERAELAFAELLKRLRGSRSVRVERSALAQS